MTIELPADVQAVISDILKSGNDCELKRNGKQLQIVEIQRKVKLKVSITTG